MYQRILCPVDGSTSAKLGMREAILLAKDQGAQLIFFHYIDTYMPVWDAVSMLDMQHFSDVLLENGKRVINEAQAEAQRLGVTAEANTVQSLGGRAAQSIVEVAVQLSCDLIVMGTHGLRGFSRFVIGSDAEQVLRTSPIPILVVKHEQGESAIKQY